MGVKEFVSRLRAFKAGQNYKARTPSEYEDLARKPSAQELELAKYREDERQKEIKSEVEQFRELKRKELLGIHEELKKESSYLNEKKAVGELQTKIKRLKEEENKLYLSKLKKNELKNIQKDKSDVSMLAKKELKARKHQAILKLKNTIAKISRPVGHTLKQFEIKKGAADRADKMIGLSAPSYKPGTYKIKKAKPVQAHESTSILRAKSPFFKF